MAIAQHEQGKVLQPLIYEDKDFAFWVETQRYKSVSWASPALEIAFTSACKTDDPTLVSTAPNDTKLENYKSRMFWIAAVAKDFHKLMQEQTAYMESELRKMAEWVDMPDGSPPFYLTP